MIISLVKRALDALFSLVCNVCAVCCGLYTLPLDVIASLSSMIVALPGHILTIFHGEI